ncbi:hypothetical protein F5887DRAFT_1077582 [Amanita rubescens]|nr:hypothetical protein F5887DRAFT_1077582 [Amanita rubescens]
MAAPPGFPIPPEIASIVAPTLIGSLVNYCLYGVLGIQISITIHSLTISYYSSVLAIYSVLIIETIQVCFNGADVFHWYAAGYGNLEMLNKVNFSPFDTPMLGAIVPFIVQLFFSYRIWTLQKSYLPISVIIGVISFLQLIGGVWGGAIGFQAKFLSLAGATPRIIYITMWLIGGAIADILIAITMTYLLRKARENAHATSHTIVTRIVRLTIQSNSLTASMALLSLILYFAFPDQPYFTPPTLILGKLYSNTLLATFNHRIFLRGEGDSKPSLPWSNNPLTTRGVTSHVAEPHKPRPYVQADVETGGKVFGRNDVQQLTPSRGVRY